MAGIRQDKEDWFRDSKEYPSECIIGRFDTEAGKLQTLSVAEVAAMLGIGSSNHNDLSGLQGGSSSERYHLTDAEHTVVGNTSGVNTGDQDLSAYALAADYIKKDGTSVTSALIPFAVGWSSAGNTLINKASPELKFQYSGFDAARLIANTGTFDIQGYTDSSNSAGQTIRVIGGDARDPDQPGGYVRLYGGAFGAGGDTQQNGFATTDTTITTFGLASSIGGIITTGNNIEDFYVGGNAYVAGNLATANGIGTNGAVLAGSGYALLAAGQANLSLGMDRHNITSGKNLSIHAGWAASGANNAAAGTLNLSSGTATGSGAGSVVIKVTGGGSSGTADRSASDSVTFILGQAIFESQNSALYKLTHGSLAAGLSLGSKTSDKISTYGVAGVAQQGATTDLGVVLSTFGIRAAGTAYPITTSGQITFNGTTDATISSGILNVSGGIRSAKKIYANTGFFAEASPSSSDVISVQPTQQIFTHGASGNTATLAYTGGTDLALTVAGAGSLGFKAPQLTASNLTSGRVTFATTSGKLTDDADFTFATDTLTVTKAVIPTSIQVGSGTVITRMDSGVYTPTLTNVANLDASTAYECQYIRIGDTVTVSGKVDIDPTAPAASTQLGISLPIASNFGALEDCAGAAFSSGIAGQGAAILADATNNRAQLQYVSGDITNQAMYFTFTYQII